MNRKLLLKSIYGFLLALVIVGIIYIILPINTSRLVATEDYATDYEEAIERYNKILERDREISDLNPNCDSRLFSHGEKKKKVLVVFHGYTACPRQFDELAQKYFEEDYNVLVTRITGHGKEKLGRGLSELTVSEMLNDIDTAIGVGAGLGESIEVTGISGGAAMAAWALENYERVDDAQLIAPIFVNTLLPDRYLKPAIKTINILPFDYYIWWDPNERAESKNIAQESYPRFSIKSFRSYMTFVADLRWRDNDPNYRGKKATLVINEADRAIVNSEVEQIFDKWVTKEEIEAEKYFFDENLGLPHNIVGSQHPDQNIDLTHKVLLDLSLN